MCEFKEACLCVILLSQVLLPSTGQILREIFILHNWAKVRLSVTTALIMWNNVSLSLI